MLDWFNAGGKKQNKWTLPQRVLTIEPYFRWGGERICMRPGRAINKSERSGVCTARSHYTGLCRCLHSYNLCNAYLTLGVSSLWLNKTAIAFLLNNPQLISAKTSQ